MMTCLDILSLSTVLRNFLLEIPNVFWLSPEKVAGCLLSLLIIPQVGLMTV